VGIIAAEKRTPFGHLMENEGSVDGRRAGVLFVDAHVHVYPVFDVDALLDAAVDNFARAARRLGLTQVPRAGLLLLTETVHDHAFEELGSGRLQPRRWSVGATAELPVLRLEHEGKPALWLVAGRQIATREDLEVLALGTNARFPDGESLEQTVAAVDAMAALTALPWGFGKWWGARGRLIDKLMHTPRTRPLYLGDNGGRLALSTRPRLLCSGESLGHKVLPGTDPLPFAGQEARVGTFGLFLPGWQATDRPLAEFARRLQVPEDSPRQFGGLTGIVPFVRLQVGMQLRKRARRGVSA
jgi:hypothetical protein